MNPKSISVWSALALLVVATACGSNPARPSTADSGSAASVSAASQTSAATPQSSTATPQSMTNAATGVTLVAPTPVSPASNAQIRHLDQPVTLVIANGVTTGSTPLTYTFEVASDAGFTSKAYTKDGVAQGANGQTSLTIDKLTPGKSYFWRARTNSGSAPGPYSSVRGFTIGQEPILQAPVLGDPAANATVDVSPTLNVNKVQRSGPVGAIVYRFDISEQANFSSIVYTANVNERTDLPVTSLVVTIKLADKTYWWRVQASDASNSLTSLSSASSFKVVHVVPFDWSQATILNSPHDLATWGETAKITSVEFTPDAMLVDFDKRNGPDRWPDTPFGAGSLEYTLGMCLNINAHWYCSGVVQFWFGRELEASGVPSEVALRWFYDGARWGPMTGYQPAEGEVIGLFVCAGNCRNNTAGDNSYVKERSNVALVPFTTNGGELFTYPSSGAAAVRVKKR